MNDAITERVFNEDGTDSDTDTDESADTFSWKHALLMLAAAVGVWTLLGATVGWSDPLPPSDLAAIEAITVALIVLVLAIAMREGARRLSLISDSIDGLWFIVLLWGLMLVVGGALAAIVLWGPPALAELLQGGAT